MCKMRRKGVIMRRSYTVSAVLLAIVFGVGCQHAFSQGKANIVILATGGTIAGAAATGTESGYTSGQVTIDAMINAVPGITDRANLTGEQVANVGSCSSLQSVVTAWAIAQYGPSAAFHGRSRCRRSA
jgi:L-asparaginase/Glu-tRNA(Gln) amidotransferase subunit D